MDNRTNVNKQVPQTFEEIDRLARKYGPEVVIRVWIDCYGRKQMTFHPPGESLMEFCERKNAENVKTD